MRSLWQRARIPALVVAVCCAVVLPVTAQARKHPSPNGRHNVSINVSLSLAKMVEEVWIIRSEFLTNIDAPAGWSRGATFR